MNDKKNARCLAQFPPGSLVKVEDLAGCEGARGKLYAMGLTPGTVLEVVSSGRGPCRLKVRNTDVVVGHGLAHKIFACPCPEAGDPDPKS